MKVSNQGNVRAVKVKMFNEKLKFIGLETNIVCEMYTCSVQSTLFLWWFSISTGTEKTIFLSYVLAGNAFWFIQSHWVWVRLLRMVYHERRQHPFIFPWVTAKLWKCHIVLPCHLPSRKQWLFMKLYRRNDNFCWRIHIFLFNNVSTG